MEICDRRYPNLFGIVHYHLSLQIRSQTEERERFDGADIAHLLFNSIAEIDWPRLMARFGTDWRVLLSHLVLFGFIYPSKRDAIPKAIMTELVRRLELDQKGPSQDENICNGTLLSRNQFISDVESNRLLDARLTERSAMTVEQVKAWTLAGLLAQGEM